MFPIAMVLKYTAAGWIRPLFAPGPTPAPKRVPARISF